MDINECRRLLDDAIYRDDLELATSVIIACRDLGDFKDGVSGEAWLADAAGRGAINVVRTLLDSGCNINVYDEHMRATALGSAIAFDQDATVQLLLERGADPNIDRSVISALNHRKAPERRLRYVRWLVEHGADVNRVYDLYGDSNNQFTALDWTDDPAVLAYLRAHGAKTAAELKAKRGESPASAAPFALADEVVRYFDENFGQVDKRALVEIVPTGHSIAIHAIRPSGDRKHLTLFTTGLSDSPMTAPLGQEEYALAELFIQLPSDGLSSMTWAVAWLRKIAQYLHDHQTWLGGPLTVIDNEDPPEPLAPDIPFTSWLLLAEKSFQRNDGHTIQLYRLTPLYPEERNLERREGAAALMRAFDRSSVPFIVDLERPSVARP